MKSYFRRLLNFLSDQTLLLSRRLEFSYCSSDIFVYRDCFETIRVLINHIKPEFLCDIGANSGDWTYVMSQMNPKLKHVVLFEPQKKYANKLQDRSLPGIQKVIYECGLGSKAESISIKGGTASASFLESAPDQSHYFPKSVLSEEELVPVRVLDQIYAEDKLPYPDVIKLDVQGFELNVLKGATRVLSHAKCLVIELSFREFYKGQPPLWEVLQFLNSHNFKMVGRGYEWRSADNRDEILQMDGIFLKQTCIGNRNNLFHLT